MDRDKLQINEKDFMTDCIETATVIVHQMFDSVDSGEESVAFRKLRLGHLNQQEMILQMALTFYEQG